MKQRPIKFSPVTLSTTLKLEDIRKKGGILVC